MVSSTLASEGRGNHALPEGAATSRVEVAPKTRQPPEKAMQTRQIANAPCPFAHETHSILGGMKTTLDVENGQPGVLEQAKSVMRV